MASKTKTKSPKTKNGAESRSKRSAQPKKASFLDDDFEAFSEEEEEEPFNGAVSEGKHNGSDDFDMNDAEDVSVEDEDSDEPFEQSKDDTELELEKLVFGDSTGFRDAIADFEENEKQESTQQTLTGVPNNDLFFLDAGTGAPQDLFKAKDTQHEEPPAAWEDSDDERMTVSLMAVPRLRKLRTFEGEDTISGTEYTQRLRQQYEALHPRPAWADWRSDRPSKRRRLSNDSAVSSDSDVSKASADDEDTPTSHAPLAKLLRSATPLTGNANSAPSTTHPPTLKPEVVSITRHPDIQPTQPHAINALAIHPTLPLLISAGLSSTVFLHRLSLRPTPPDPPNPLLTSLHLKNTPLTTAAFSPTADASTGDPRIYLSAPRRYFHTWSLPTGAITKTTRIYGEQGTTQRKCTVLKPSPCGRYLALEGTTRKGSGVVNVLSAATTAWLFQAAVDGRGGLAAFAWWADGAGLTLVSKTGQVVEYSTDARAVVARWADPGAVGVTALALAADPGMPYARTKRKARAVERATAPSGLYLGPDRHVLLGLNSGIVLLYDRRALLETPAQMAPTKTLAQLTTPVSVLAASPCGQLVAAASRWKKDALRLLHLPSGTVYRNWPTAKTPVGRVASLALGEVDEGDGVARVLVVGGENGALRVWEVGS